MIIRPETPADVDAITAVTAAAFRDHPFSRQTEPFIVLALRRVGVLAVSLVAEDDGRVVGHVAFSPVVMSDGTAGWYGLGPVSVLPEHQRCGIGGALVTEGLAAVKTLGGRGCVLVGDPAWYRRFGFANPAGLVHPGVPPEVFLALAFGDPVPRGAVTFHAAFAAEA